MTTVGITFHVGLGRFFGRIECNVSKNLASGKIKIFNRFLTDQNDFQTHVLIISYVLK